MTNTNINQKGGARKGAGRPRKDIKSPTSVIVLSGEPAEVWLKASPEKRAAFRAEVHKTLVESQYSFRLETEGVDDPKAEARAEQAVRDELKRRGLTARDLYEASYEDDEWRESELDDALLKIAETEFFKGWESIPDCGGIFIVAEKL
jgi:hypothetical protein